MRRTRWLQIRATEEELRQIQAEADYMGLNKAEYIREMCLPKLGKRSRMRARGQKKKPFTENEKVVATARAITAAPKVEKLVQKAMDKIKPGLIEAARKAAKR